MMKPPKPNPSNNPNQTNNQQQPLCYGRITDQDFERLVPDQWWKTVFADDLYLQTDGDVVEDPQITREEIRMLEKCPAVAQLLLNGLQRPLQVNRRTHVLDLCCGQGRHTLMLAQKYPQLALFGHDQSSYLIDLAKERLQQQLKEVHDETLFQSSSSENVPQFTVGDCREIPHQDQFFDLCMVMGNSFGYFGNGNNSGQSEVEDSMAIDTSTTTPLDGDRQVLKEMNRVLKHNGVMVLDLADGEYMRNNFSPRSWEWIDDQTLACRERTLSADRKRLHSREVVVAVQRGVVRDQFYSERLYGREELVELLREAGFAVCDGTVETDHALKQSHSAESVSGDVVTTARELSQRGQDLGMMEQRLLLIARKVEEHPLLVEERQQVLLMEEREKQRMLIDSAIASPVSTVLSGVPESETGAEKPVTESSVRVIDWRPSHPREYYDFPAPPFPRGQLSVLLGDISIPCREKLNGQWNQEDFDTRQKLLDALVQCGYPRESIIVLSSHRDLLARVHHHPPAFVLNLCDEGFKNDALKELHVPALLEMCGVAYSGAGPASLAICYDKGLVNSTAARLGIPTPRETHLIIPESMPLVEITEDFLMQLLIKKEIAGELRYPAFLKPMKGDNSLGITDRSICSCRNDLAAYIKSLVDSYQFREFIAQEYLTGTEYSVGIIGNPETGYHFLPILQVDYSRVVQEYGLKPILGWESKWDPSSPYWNEIDYVASPRIPDVKYHTKSTDVNFAEYRTGGLSFCEEEELKRHCTILFERFGCRDYARFDWRADREIWHHPKSGHILTRVPGSDSPSRNGSPSADTDPPILDADVADDNLSTSSSFSAQSFSSSLGSNNRLNDSGHGSSSSRSRDDVLDVSGHKRRSHSSGLLREIKLLEVNPNPGWCWDGKFAKMAHSENREYSDMLKSILWASWERIYGSTVPKSQLLREQQ